MHAYSSLKSSPLKQSIKDGSATFQVKSSVDNQYDILKQENIFKNTIKKKIIYCYKGGFSTT